jgi:hypothetical protein
VIGNAVHVMRIATGEVEDASPDQGKDPAAIEGAFGGDIDYAILIKMYGATSENAKGRYSRAECIGARKERIEGNPDPKHLSTSYAERQNLTMRILTARRRRRGEKGGKRGFLKRCRWQRGTHAASQLGSIACIR